MKNNFASVEINGVLGYLWKRSSMRYLPNLGKKKSRIEIYGHNIFINKKDLEQNYFSEDCIREPENLIVYRALSASGLAKCFIDIGANCGHVATSIVDCYESIILFEPNPHLASLLRQIFKNKGNVLIKECAVVDSSLVGKITLNVPEMSSGLASLGTTSLSKKHIAMHAYSVNANTLESELEGIPLSDAYIKIDVEGFEYDVIKSSIDLILKDRPIVGFEALSFKAAEKCFSLFSSYKFYCARFNFLENGGALASSGGGILKALFSGFSVDFIRINQFEPSQLENFSQIFSVPVEKCEAFERSILEYIDNTGVINVNNLKSWSK